MGNTGYRINGHSVSADTYRVHAWRRSPSAWVRHKLGVDLARYRPLAELETLLADTPADAHQWARQRLAAGKLILDGTRSYQAEALDRMATPGRYAYQWANGVAKTATAAMWVLWFLDNYPGGRLLTTAGTWSQLKEQLWREIPTWAARAVLPIIPSIDKINKTSIDIAPDWAAIARAASEGSKFEGVHAKYVAVLMDEAKAIKPEIFDAVRRILRQAPDAKIWWICLSSPGSPAGPFWDITHGDQSHRWHTFRLSAYESERVTLEQIEEDRQDLGETSPLFISMNLGEFPEEGEDTVLPLSWVQAAVERPVLEDHPFALGCDVARFGGDETAIMAAWGRRFELLDTYQGKDTVWTAGRLTELCRANDRIGAIGVDDTGVGGGVTDQLYAAGLPVHGINFAAADLVRDETRYVNIKAEGYYALRAEFEAGFKDPANPALGLSIPNDKRLIHQLTMQRYEFDARQRYRIESHAKLARRNERSPDRADALMLAWLVRSRWGRRDMAYGGSGHRRTSAPAAPRREEAVSLARSGVSRGGGLGL